MPNCCLIGTKISVFGPSDSPAFANRTSLMLNRGPSSSYTFSSEYGSFLNIWSNSLTALYASIYYRFYNNSFQFYSNNKDYGVGAQFNEESVDYDYIFM